MLWVITNQNFPIYSSKFQAPNLTSLPLIFFLNFTPPSPLLYPTQSSSPKACSLLSQTWNLCRILEFCLLLELCGWLGFSCFSLLWCCIWFYDLFQLIRHGNFCVGLRNWSKTQERIQTKLLELNPRKPSIPWIVQVDLQR